MSLVLAFLCSFFCQTKKKYTSKIMAKPERMCTARTYIWTDGIYEFAVTVIVLSTVPYTLPYVHNWKCWTEQNNDSESQKYVGQMACTV